MGRTVVSVASPCAARNCAPWEEHSRARSHMVQPSKGRGAGTGSWPAPPPPPAIPSGDDASHRHRGEGCWPGRVDRPARTETGSANPPPSGVGCHGPQVKRGQSRRLPLQRRRRRSKGRARTDARPSVKTGKVHSATACRPASGRNSGPGPRQGSAPTWTSAEQHPRWTPTTAPSVPAGSWWSPPAPATCGDDCPWMTSPWPPPRPVTTRWARPPCP